MTEEKQSINIVISDGEPFFAHEVSVNYTPTQFTLDFKCITPRTDPRSQKPNFLMKHNVVMIEPWHLKSLMEVLSNVVKKYEDDFGKVGKPKPLLDAEKKHKSMMKKAKGAKEKTTAPSYLG